MKKQEWLFLSVILLQGCLERPAVVTAGRMAAQFSHEAVNSCLPCHASQWPSAAAVPGHPQPPGLDCVTCHTHPGVSWAQSGGGGSPHPNNVGLNSCVGCHESMRPSVTVMNPAGGISFTLNTHFAGTDCFQCHDPKSATVSSFVFDHQANGNSPTSCAVCHESQRPGGHHVGQDCVSCHSYSSSGW